MIKGGLRCLSSLALGLLVASLLVPSERTQAATPETISFQARVLSKDRSQAPTGNFAFRFSLFTTQTGGSSVWQESWTGNGLPVRYGLFNVELGSQSSLTGLDWGNNTYWLGIEFDSDQNGTFDQAFSSRVPMTAAPYALSAKTISSTLGLAQGGTGATTASAALNNLLPSQAGQAGKVLLSNGTTASWSSFNGGAADATYITLGNHSGLSNERVLQGTSNQVLISDGGADGKVTLSLPQDIGPGSSVFFKKISLGTTLNAGSDTYPLFYDDPNSTREIAITSEGQLRLIGDTATNSAVRIQVAGDSTERFVIKSSGQLVWGNGTDDRDTNLYRSAADNLKTDDGLIIGGSTTALSDSIKLEVNGHALIKSPGTSGATLYLDASNNSGSLFRVVSTGPTASWGGQFSGANSFTIVDANQPWLWISTANDKLVVNSDLEVTDNIRALAQGDLRLYETDSTNYVGLQAPSSVSANLVWTLPGTDSSGCLSSNGSGTLSWSSCSGASGAPTSASYLTLGLDSTLTTERVLVGTTNQVILTDGGANGNLTLSLPQSIATSSAPTFANLTDSGLTAGRLTYAGTNGLLQDTANMTYGSTYGLSLAAGSTSGLQLSSTAGTSVGGVLFGTDTNLYRGAANELSTDDLISFSSAKTNTVTDFKTYKSDGGMAFIFDTSSTYSTGSLLSVRNNGNAKLNLSASGNLTIAGTLTQSGTPADLAENIAVSDDSAAGDIVTVDSTIDQTVRKATSGDRVVVGVISTEPGILISGATTGKPLALAGRVPVNVVPTADIHRGDQVIVSSTPGLGTKAGDAAAASIGVALTDQVDGVVMVQLNPGYYLPAFGNTIESVALSPQQSGILDSFSLIDGSLSVDSLIVDRLAVKTSLVVNGDLTVTGGLNLPALESASATIAAGQTRVFVDTSRVKSGDRVLVTPVVELGQTLNASLSRGEIVDGQGFWIYLSTAQSSSVKFDWLLIH